MTLCLSSGQVSLLKWGTSGSTSGLQCKGDRWQNGVMRKGIAEHQSACSHYRWSTLNLAFAQTLHLEDICLFHWPSLWVSGAGPLAPCVSAGYQSQVSFRKMAMSHLGLFIIPIIGSSGFTKWDLQSAGGWNTSWTWSLPWRQLPQRSSCVGLLSCHCQSCLLSCQPLCQDSFLKAVGET